MCQGIIPIQSPHLTPHEADGGESAHFLEVFSCWVFAPTAANAHRWALDEERTMKRLNSILILLIVAISFFPLVSCGRTTITNNDRIEIYELAIKTIVLRDNGFGKAVNIDHLYILKNTDDRIGGKEIPNLPSQALGDVVMRELETKLSDLAPQIIWVDDDSEVPMSTEGGAAVKDGAIITLGNIRYKSNSEVYVSIGIYFANVSGSTRTYVAKKDDNGWIISERVSGQDA